MCLDPGTQQSDHLALPVHFFAVCQSNTWQNDLNFAVCQDPWHTAKFKSSPCAMDLGTRRSLNLCRVPQILAHGEVESRAVIPRAVTVPAPPPPSATLSRRVPPLAHGERLCRAPDKRHTAKWPLPSRLVAVEGSPWAAHGERLCRVLSGLRLCFWHTANGGNPVVREEYFFRKHNRFK